MQLSITQAHIQKLSAKVEQSIHILQMDSQCLEKYVSEIMLENPVVEIDTPSFESAEADRAMADPINPYTSLRYAASNACGIDNFNSLIENIAAPREEESLTNYLLSQIRCRFSGEMAQHLCYLVSFINDNGYLDPSFERICILGKYGKGKLSLALKQLQSLDPSGVGASTLAECLCLQLGMDDKLARLIVTEYLNEVAYGEAAVIARKVRAPLSEVEAAIARIKMLNPKPGVSYSGPSEPLYVIPDVMVRKEPGGKFHISLSESLTPSIYPNKAYIEMAHAAADPEVIEYIKTKVEQYNWLSKCLANRNKTLLELARVIVSHQERFFKHGAFFLNSFRMKDAADMLGVHESTVSRAVKGKYLQCDHGTFPMKYFFVRSVQHDAPEVSVLDAKRELMRIISSENPDLPYSDQFLSNKIADTGIHISRRTVAKYRLDLGIPAASVRSRGYGKKKFKKSIAHHRP